MKKTIYISLLLTIFISCSEDKGKTRTEFRTLYVYDYDTLKQDKNYILTIESREKLTIYSYINQVDEDDTLKLFYSLTTSNLRFGMWDYRPVKNDSLRFPSLDSSSFLLYIMKEPEIDGTSPIIFNPKYGLLGIRNVMAPDFIYLTKENDAILAEKILSILNQ